MNPKPVNPNLPGRYGKMTAEELDAEVAQFDEPFVGTPGQPLTPAQKAQHRRARLKAGRPRVGKGAKRVLVTIERSLLGRTDKFARKHGLSRAQLIARGLETYMKLAS